MPRLILLLAILFVLYILFRRVGAMPPHLRRKEYIKLAGGATVVAVVVLAAMGKMHWVGAALAGLLVALRQSVPLLLRIFPMLGGFGKTSSASAQQSTVNTDTLSMHLDLESGAMSGEVIAGPFKDWLLDEMSREQLTLLAQYCSDQDPDALQLLEGYLEQRFDDQAECDEHGAAGTSDSGALTRQEALEILGLGEDADRAAIVDAHRKLMQKLHPDRGGSDYLAAKINQAKDFLLEA